MPESKAQEQIRRSWEDEEPSLKMDAASARSGLSTRTLRRLIDEGYIYASQARPGVKGSHLRISKASLVDYLVETIR